MSNRPEPDPLNIPDVDTVPGDPPVPVNIWRLPVEDTPVGARLAARLLAEYTRPGELVHDTVPSPALRSAARDTGRGYQAPGRRFHTHPRPAALAVLVWPPADPDPAAALQTVYRRLQPGGYLAVVVTAAAGPAPPVELGLIVAEATTAGLSYLQHIVTMPTPPTPTPGSALPGAGGVGRGVHQRVHSDILVFSRAGGAGV